MVAINKREFVHQKQVDNKGQVNGFLWFYDLSHERAESVCDVSLIHLMVCLLGGSVRINH